MNGPLVIIFPQVPLFDLPEPQIWMHGACEPHVVPHDLGVAGTGSLRTVALVFGRRQRRAGLIPPAGRWGLEIHRAPRFRCSASLSNHHDAGRGVRSAGIYPLVRL